MIRNYFKTAFRYLERHKLYTSINILGLTLGITCALLAILYVKDEMSFDDFHQKGKQLYRITTTVSRPRDGLEVLGTTGQVQGPAFKAAIPEIEDYTRILGMDGINLTSGSKSIAVKNLYVDEGFFNLFSFPFLRGDSKTALGQPASIVLSETTAQKLFNTTDVVGKALKIEEGSGTENLTITGVAKDAPSNSSIQFDVLIPFKYLQKMFKDDNWLNNYLTTFILLHPAASPKAVSQKFSQVFQLNAKEQLAKEPGYHYQFGLLPISAIHLNPLGVAANGTADVEQGLSGGSTITYTYLLTGIVAFILIMACVNFINLSIAGSLKRAKEVGVRKVAGSTKIQIVKQFLVEAAVQCGLSWVLAIAFCALLLPVFNQISGKTILLSNLVSPGLFIYGTLLMLLCLFVAGLYPALVLSFYNPAEVLYNRQKLKHKNLLGKSLIVLQFTLAVALIIGTLVYYGQMNFISKQDLGYNASNMIKIHLPPQRITRSTIWLFRSQLLQDPAVKEVTGSSGISRNTVAVNGKKLDVKQDHIDEFYLPAFEIALKSGRNFYKSSATDSSNAVIVNEAFVRSAGLENPIGQQLTNPDNQHKMTVVGVVKDYHYGSLKEKIGPQVLSRGDNEYLFIKIQPGKIAAALPFVEKTFKQIFPAHYFSYTFLDDENAIAYQNDKKWQQIITASAGLAILICCVGLFGLTSFAARQRIKEIGVRKVLGASAAGITLLLSKDFLKLVIAAIIIASPVAWLVMNQWLQNFAYHITIGWGVFLMAGMFATSIALLTVSFQAIKAATSNPVSSLRTE
ncbi:MAG TPA: ABC transporter permease [Mucilaginibacter sp.]|nr:ABC transporter permease [Mucilaginibacter sp.]